MKNIVITNMHSTLNKGDLALLETTIDILRRIFCDPKITVISNWPDEDWYKQNNVSVIPSPWSTLDCGNNNKATWLKALKFLYYFIEIQLVLTRLISKINSQSWQEIYDVLSGSDLVLGISGHSIFSFKKHVWPLPVILFPLFLAQKLQKRTVLLPQSIGPLDNRLAKWLVKKSLKNSEHIFLRDKISFDFAQSLFYKEKVIISLTNDIAFNLSPISKDAAVELLSRYGYHPKNKIIGFTLVANMPSQLDKHSIENYHEIVAKTISTLIRDEFEIFIFPQVVGPLSVEDDRVAIRSVISIINDSKNKIHLVDADLSPQELKGCYGLCDLFIASRMHSGIFSVSMNVPTLFIGYLSKTRGLLQQLGLEYLLLDLNGLNFDNLYKNINLVWDNRLQIQEKLKIVNENIHNRSKIFFLNLAALVKDEE